MAENIDNLISRQQAIDAMAELQGRASSKGELKGISKAWKRINKLPPIQPERKNGNWVWKDKKEFCPSDCWFPPTGFEDTWNEKEGSWIEKELYCSECNFENWRHYKSNFCPYCGVDMRGEQDG